MCHYKNECYSNANDQNDKTVMVHQLIQSQIKIRVNVLANSPPLPPLPLAEEEEVEVEEKEASQVSSLPLLPQTLMHIVKIEALAQPPLEKLLHMSQNSTLLSLTEARPHPIVALLSITSR